MTASEPRASGGAYLALGVAQVAVEVDGRPVLSHCDATSGRLTADLQPPPGQHQVRIRAHNHARVRAVVDLTLR